MKKPSNAFALFPVKALEKKLKYCNYLLCFENKMIQGFPNSIKR